MKIPFPTGPRALVTDSFHRYLERTYKLGVAMSMADLGGAYNLNAPVTSDKGRFVARVYRPWVTRPRLRAFQHLRHQLKAQRLPIILSLPKADGRMVAAFDHRVLELEPFVPNSGAVESWERYEKAFSLLGRLTVLCPGRSQP